MSREEVCLSIPGSRCYWIEPGLDLDLNLDLDFEFEHELELGIERGLPG